MTLVWVALYAQNAAPAGACRCTPSDLLERRAADGAWCSTSTDPRDPDKLRQGSIATDLMKPIWSRSISSATGSGDAVARADDRPGACSSRSHRADRRAGAGVLARFGLSFVLGYLVNFMLNFCMNLTPSGRWRLRGAADGAWITDLSAGRSSRCCSSPAALQTDAPAAAVRGVYSTPLLIYVASSRPRATPPALRLAAFWLGSRWARSRR